MRGTGVATYAATLAAALPGIGLAPEFLVAQPSWPRPLRWLAAAWPGPCPSIAAPPRRTAPDVFRVAQVHFDLYGRPLRLIGRQRPDLMHWTYPLPLRMAGRPNIYTVHDLIPLLHPTLTGIEPGRFRRILVAILRRADHVVTVSEATRHELIRHLGLDPARVTNTWQAVDVSRAVPPAIEDLVAGEYWLHVGAVERRKNLPRLIAAWQTSGAARPLVLAGPDGWQAAETMNAAAPFLRPGAAPRIIRLPWLDRPRLLGLIRDARALLMPSLAEGFGLPVAEAMALGTPVLTSHHGALAEIAGPAALLVDPGDVRAIAAGLRALDGNAALHDRLARTGPARAAMFSPDAYAARLNTLYAGLLP